MSWTITEGPEQIPSDRDAALYRWTVENDGERRRITVGIPGTLLAVEPSTLASPLDEMVTSKGRAAIEAALAEGRVPSSIEITRTGPQES